MGIFDDILKGLPVNPLLREKIADVEVKFAASELRIRFSKTIFAMRKRR